MPLPIIVGAALIKACVHHAATKSAVTHTVHHTATATGPKVHSNEFVKEGFEHVIEHAGEDDDRRRVDDDD